MLLGYKFGRKQIKIVNASKHLNDYNCTISNREQINDSISKIYQKKIKGMIDKKRKNIYHAILQLVTYSYFEI